MEKLFEELFRFQKEQKIIVPSDYIYALLNFPQQFHHQAGKLFNVKKGIFDPVQFGGFYDLNLIKEYNIDYKNLKEPFIERFLAIGHLEGNHTLLIGNTVSELNQIWIYYADYKSLFFRNESIFDFIKELK